MNPDNSRVKRKLVSYDSSILYDDNSIDYIVLKLNELKDELDLNKIIQKKEIKKVSK